METLCTLLHERAVAYIAATVRNEDTTRQFFIRCLTAGLDVQNWDEGMKVMASQEKTYFFHSEDFLVALLMVRKGQTTNVDERVQELMESI